MMQVLKYEDIVMSQPVLNIHNYYSQIMMIIHLVVVVQSIIWVEFMERLQMLQVISEVCVLEHLQMVVLYQKE